MASKKTTTRHSHKVLKDGTVKVTQTKKPRGVIGKLTDKTLKGMGK